MARWRRIIRLESSRPVRDGRATRRRPWLFRWIKQHLKIRKFLSANENAIKLQVYAAMIAYALLRLAAKTKKVAHSILRFTDLMRKFLFERRKLAAIEKPPAVNPNRKRDKSSPDQMSFCYV